MVFWAYPLDLERITDSYAAAAATVLVDILVSIVPDLYGPYVTMNKSGQKVLIVECLNTIYGTMVAASAPIEVRGILCVRFVDKFK